MKRMGFMQILKSPAIYLSVLGVAIICFISVQPYMDQKVEGGGVAYYFDLLLGLSMSKKLITLCSALPGVALFCGDWSCQYIRPVVIRSGVKAYIRSRCLTCFLSAFATSFLGMTLFIACLSTKMSVFNLQNMEDQVSPPFAVLAYSPLPVLYIFAHIFVFSLAMALWAMVGLALSAYVPNRFVAVATPVVASYLVEELTGLLPRFLNIYSLTRSGDVIGQGAAVSFLYFVFFFVSLSTVFGVIFYFRVRGRIRNEII